MHRPIWRRFGAAATAMLLGAVLVTAAEADVRVRLTAHRVVRNAAGAEVFESAGHIEPGQLVEYRAVYHNAGDAGVQQLLATIPIPAGTGFVPGTASPTGAMASLDGSTYAPIPLKRKVRLADGREVERDVPAAEYRFLRWSLGTLASKQERTVQARVRVTALLSAETTP